LTPHNTAVAEPQSIDSQWYPQGTAFALTLCNPACYPTTEMEIPKRQSLVKQTADVLRRRFAASAAGTVLPGERELAETLEVSRKTLRAALQLLEQDGIVCTSGNRRRVIATPRSRTRTRRSGEAGDVVLLTPVPLMSIPSPDGLLWVDHLRESLAKERHELHVLSRPQCYSRSPHRALEELTARVRPAAWVLLISTRPLQEWFAARRLPAVVAGSRHEGVKLPAVDRDLRAVGRHAAGRFAAKGHRCVAYVELEPIAAGDFDARAGFREGCAGASRSLQLLDVQHDGTVEGICLKLDRVLASSRAPTAFLTTSTKHTLTVLTHLLRRGVHLPRDAALISRDGDRFLECVVPSVAHYYTNPHVYARALIRIVRDMISGREPIAKDHLLMPDFITGETLG